MTHKNPLLYAITNWFNRTFSDPAAVSLFFMLLFGFLFLEFFGSLFMPVIVSIIIAYLLHAPVTFLERWKVPHLLAVVIVYALFIGLLVFALIVLIPLLWKELSNLIQELPLAFNHSQTWLLQFKQKYPKYFADMELQNAILFFRDQSARVGQFILHYSLGWIPGAIQVILYFVLVPLLVFFFLSDSKQILNWFSRFMPNHRTLVTQVWSEVHGKIGAYVRGRVLEIVIVGVITSFVFAILELQYSVLLGALVGLSVIVPYIGAVVVTIPVIIIALMQWGLSAHFSYLLIAYALIIVLDGNLLVPLLFSGSMSLHPVVIIISVIVFGAFWGFWGIFFAIPLATLVNAVLHAWPSRK
jgi:putative permease